MKTVLLFVFIVMINCNGFSQQNLFEPREIQQAYEDGTRSRKGIPGENYWQNNINYKLKTKLDPTSRLLKGTGSITYFNNSPDTLKYLVIKLLPNIHKKGGARDYKVGAEHLNDGMIIDSIAIKDHGQQIENHRKFREYGTNLYVILDKSERIPPGSETEVYISWDYEVIKNGIRNGAYTDSSFFIGFWYPQIAVYDDVYGWDKEDYTGIQETYNELGNYDVEITVPPDYLVWATGDQLNENEIYSDYTTGLMKESKKSIETIHIVSDESYKNNSIFRKNHSTTWKYKAEQVPDFAWACSNYYNWDANGLTLENNNNKEVWINAVYPPGTATFDRVAKVARQSIDYLSNEFPGIPYPFNKHITFNGIHYVAVEYPMMANNSDYPDEESYTELTVHEIAHNYIPFYMLSNERKHAWIDEGWVKLIGELYGESTGIKREDKKALNTIQIYERSAGRSNDLPLIVPSGFMTARDNFFHSYAKAANANMLLLDLMKEKGVENPLKSFLLTWKGKHPNPYDFFYYMNELAGEDLSWYWNPWYFEFNSPDLAIKKGDNKNEILVINKGGIPLPVKLTITYHDDNVEIIDKGIWSWAENQSRVSIKISNLAAVKMITLGAPFIPDINKENNKLILENEIIGKL